MFILISACAKEGDFTLINRCNHNVYYTIQNRDYTLPPSQSRTHSFSVGKQTPFNTAEKEIGIKIEGETYIMTDSYNNDLEYTDTSVNIQADKNLKAYLYPNRAGLKIVNLSSKKYRNLVYKQHFEGHTYASDDLFFYQDLNPQDSLWFRLPYSNMNPDNPNYFFYTFEIRDEEGNILTFGDQTTVLDKDVQYRIELTD